MHWIKTNTFDLSSRRGKAKNNLERQLLLSPYDVPNAVRTYSEDDKIVIEFKYINISEHRDLHKGDNGDVTLEVGEQSKRLYKIFIKQSVLDHYDQTLPRNLLPVKSVLDDFISHQENMNRNTAKYTAALSAISDNYDSLAAGV
jgi:hypothetical protein